MNIVKLEDFFDFKSKKPINRLAYTKEDLDYKIECIKTKLVNKEGETRAIPVDIDGSNYDIQMDYVVMAIGSKTEDNVVQGLNVDLSSRGYIIVNEKYMTSIKGVFAGGDLIGQKATVAWAARSGRNVANEIEGFLGRSKSGQKCPKRDRPM